jgi:hypothetical protein
VSQTDASISVESGKERKPTQLNSHGEETWCALCLPLVAWVSQSAAVRWWVGSSWCLFSFSSRRVRISGAKEIALAKTSEAKLQLLSAPILSLAASLIASNSGTETIEISFQFELGTHKCNLLKSILIGK